MSQTKIDIDEGIQSEVTEQAIYNMVMYMPLDKLKVKKGDSIGEIIKKADTNIDTVKGIDKAVLQSLIEFEQSHPDSDVLKATISNMSYMSDDKLIQNTGAFSAAVFTDPDGNKSVNFRGTPARAWMDNADGLSGILRAVYELNGNKWNYLSEIDKAALDYYQDIREELKKDGKDITIGGHSKGGHEALLVALLFSDDISACYAFDGQSISPEMWKEIKELYKDNPEKLQAIRDKITAVNLDNDYVHVLGWTEEDGYIASNVIVIEGSEECSVNPLANHFMQSFFNGKGFLNPISKEGEGAIAKFLLQVSDRIMKLESPKREKVARSVMMILQFAQGQKWPVNFTIMDMVEVLADLDDGLETAVEILTDVINNTEEGKELVEYLKGLPIGGRIQQMLADAKKHPLIANAVLKISSAVIQLVLSLGEKVITVAEIIVWIKNTGEAVIAAIQSGAQWIYEAGSALVEGIKNKVLEMGRLITEAAQSVGTAAAGIAKKTLLILQHQLNQAAQWIEHTTQTMLNFISDIAEQWKRSFAFLKNSLAQGIENCKSMFTSMEAQVKQGLLQAGEAVAHAVSQAKGKIEGFAVSIKDQITDAVKAGNAALNQGMERIKAGFTDISEAAKDAAVNVIKDAADSISAALTATQTAVFDSAEKIKDSVLGGISILTDTVAAFEGWLKEKGHAPAEVTVSQMNGIMTGKAGIDYAMIDEVRLRIEDFCHEAANLEREIDYVLSDLSGLRYTSVNKSYLMEARAQVTKQKHNMSRHAEDLSEYKSMCIQTEAEFVQALNCYA